MRLHGLTLDTFIVLLIVMMGVLMVQHDFFLASIDEGPLENNKQSLTLIDSLQMHHETEKDLPALSVKALWTQNKKTRDIQVDAHYLQQLLTGDEFMIPSFDTQAVYRARMVDVLAFKNGDRSWRATIETNADVYSVSLSMGGNTVYGLINTPEGMYSVKGSPQDVRVNEIYDVDKFNQDAKHHQTAMTIIKPIF